jgi:hypothetical protein
VISVYSKQSCDARTGKLGKGQKVILQDMLDLKHKEDGGRRRGRGGFPPALPPPLPPPPVMGKKERDA